MSKVIILRFHYASHTNSACFIRISGIKRSMDKSIKECFSGQISLLEAIKRLMDKSIKENWVSSQRAR
jgi:hypothetical protein